MKHPARPFRLQHIRDRHDPLSLVIRLLVSLAALLTVGILLLLVGYILIKGIPHLRPSLFALHYNSENVSLLPALLNTLMIILLTLIIAVPLGIFSALYLSEYAGRSNRFVQWIRLATETLAGIPSIIYGLFGMLFFVTFLHWGYSLLAGACTLAIMILPLLMRTTEEALHSVPDAYREGSYALGAGRLRTIFNIVLPAAMPGILAGVILSIGRIVGESAALIYTAGTASQIANGLFSSGRTLSVHMYNISNEGLYLNQTYATAVVLLILVALVNWISHFVAGKLTKGS
ncbi:MAG: phosphate ABC transporter permease PstA [Negativicutes bacterium]|nr:phosphate ABC transporter permease PstA [Negativicutes bacterium]